MKELSRSRALVPLLRGAAVATLVVFVGGFAALAAPESPRATMHRVFDAVTVLLPLSLDRDRFAAASAQPEISRAIQALSGAARELENHGAGRDRSFRYLSRSLASDVEEIRHRYDFGRLEEARFFILESSRHCVACHSRLPRERDFPLADRLLERVDMKSLSHHERSQLYVITRQFDRALENWEELFGEWIVSPGQLDAGGYLRDYLAVAIRVEGSYGRARKHLEALKKRVELPEYLSRQLEAWIRDLRKFESAPPELGDIAALRRIVEQAAPAGGTGDANSMVADLVASAGLLRLLDKHAGRQGKDAELAEIYYLLGLVEARTIESFWVPQAPFHLELAIRLAPTGPRAESALRMIEEQFEIGYGGLSSEVLPLDLWTKLEELRGLVRTES